MTNGVDLKSNRAQAVSEQRRHRATLKFPSAVPAKFKPVASAESPAAPQVYWSPRKKVDFYQFDAKYLENLRNGDSATQKHFADYFGERLRAKLLNRGFAIATLEDISQETLLRVFAAVRNGAVLYPERFGAYVNSVCDRVILEKYREHARHQHLDVDAMELPDGKTSLEAIILRKEKKKIVADILALMPVKKRNILRALIFEQLDREELCARFKVKSDYLRVLLFRAKEDFAALCKARGLDRLNDTLS